MHNYMTITKDSSLLDVFAVAMFRLTIYLPLYTLNLVVRVLTYFAKN